MNAALREALRVNLDELSRLRVEVAELSARLALLEGRDLNGGAGFSYVGHVAARRRAVIELRSSGLSIAAIAEQLRVAASTVERDLEAVPHTPPTYVLGRDRKRHPSRKNGRAAA